MGLVNQNILWRLFMFYEFTKQQANRAKIKEICPNVKTIAETYLDDQGWVNIVCREKQCSENELLLTLEEYTYLRSYEYR